MIDIDIPEGLAMDIKRQAGTAADSWLAGLPALVERLCDEWNLTIEGSPMHGARGLVLLVDRHSEKLALKVAWPDETTAQEYRALAAWDGRSMVRLLDSRPTTGSALLERLDANRPLSSVPIADAISVAGGLIRTLSVETDVQFPTMAERTVEISTTLPVRWETMGRPFPRRLLDMSLQHALQLGQRPARTMVDWDLHYDNILGGSRLPWIAVDPMVVLGDPELGLAQLLWTRLDEIDGPNLLRILFDTLIDRAGLDRTLAEAWAIVRLTDYWLWALGVGLTIDPVRCATAIEWLGY